MFLPMGVRDWFTRRLDFTEQAAEILADASREPAEASFAVDADSIDPAVFGLTSYASPLAPSPRVERRLAMQSGSVKRCRDLVPGVLGTLPWGFIGPDMRTAAPTGLLAQPEKNVPRSVTFTRLFEDMYFEQIGWWHVTDFGWHGYPIQVERMKPREVNVNEDTGKVYWKGREIPDRELIRFDSPTDGLLIAGARAVRTLLMLDAAHLNYVDGAPPIDYFTPADGAEDPDDDAEIITLLDNWLEARRTRGTAYVPKALKYNLGGWSPKDLAMGDARKEAVLEVARHGGVDPEELGVSTTSRTYSNQFDRRKQFTDFTLGLFYTAMQDRLSMNDICPRGYTARINLNELLRSDPKTRYEAYEVGLRVGALTPEQIKELEGNPTVNQPTAAQPAPAPAAPADGPAASLTLVAGDGGTFAAEAPDLQLSIVPETDAEFAVDREGRTITGLIVPYGVAAASKGQLWQFSQGTLRYADPTRIKLWIEHDPSRAVGVATSLDDRAEGMFGTFKIARGASGDEALSMAEDKVRDGFSIGVARGGKYRRVGTVNHAVEAPLMEVSLTPLPSFDGALVHSVAASAANGSTKGNGMTPEEKARLAELRQKGEAAFSATERLEFSRLVAKETGAADQITEEPGSLDFDALSAGITDAIGTAFANLGNPQGQGREVVSAGGRLEHVEEPTPYRFDGVQGEHSFSEDVRLSSQGDADARTRLTEFMEVAFAVSTGNTAALNPVQNRPDLYVPNLTFTRPLWDLISKGSITDRTPFTVPKFVSATGLVGDHTEGVEPTPGTFVATSETVTPGALSGKIEINREVLDSGGSPQADQIIWGEMLNAWYEAIEAKIAAELASTDTAEINLAGVEDDALVDAVEGIFTGLQFVRGGNRFRAFATDGTLFGALVAAKDTTGRKLLPVVGPSNADGTTSGDFSAVQVGNQKAVAAWALGSGNDALSYLFVPSSVYAWVSAPKRFTFEYQVKSVDMAIWGYAATHTLRNSDVKPIDYTTADV